MKYIVAITIAVFIALSCFSQSVQINSSFTFKAASGGTKMIVLGSIEGDTVYIPFHAPDYTPKRAGALVYWDSVVYVYAGTAWIPIGSGGGGGGSFQYHTAGFGLIGADYNGTIPQTWQVDSTVYGTINYISNFFPTDSIFNANFIVDSITNVPPASPVDSSFVLVGQNPTGVFLGHENQVAQRIGSGWAYTIASVNDKLINAANDVVYNFNGTTWVATAVPILNNGNPQKVNLTIQPYKGKTFSVKTNNLIRFKIDTVGNFYYYKYKSPSFPYTNFLRVDTATGKIFLDSSFELVAGSGIYFTGTHNEIINSSGGGTASRFGIEDNTGVQNRIMDLSNYSFDIFGVGYTGIKFQGGSGAFVNIYTDYTSDDLYLSVDKSNGEKTIIRPRALNMTYGTYDGMLNANPAPTGNEYLTFPDGNGSHTIPISVNGNFADSTGNITISASGSAGIHAVYNGYGLGKTNDSTLYFLPPLRDSIIALIPSLSGYVNAIAGENYLSKSGSTITANAVNLSGTNVTGNLPVTKLNSGTSASSTTFWRGDGTWGTPAGTATGSVTSVAMTMPGVLFNSTVSGSPITTSGTLAPALISQSAWNLFGNHTNASATPTFGHLKADHMNTTYSAGQHLQTDVSGNLSWVTPSSGGGSGAAYGDSSYTKQPAAMTIFTQTNFTASTGYTVTGSPTITYTNGAMVLTGGANDFTQYISLNSLSNSSDQKDYVIKFKATVLGNGIGIASKSVNTWQPASAICKLNTSSSTLAWYNNAGTLQSTATLPFTIAANDFLTLTLSVRGHKAAFIIKDETSNADPYPLKFTYNANSGDLAIYNFGGTNAISSATFLYTGYQNAYVNYIGDSKTQGLGSTVTFADEAKIGTYNVFAGVSDGTPEVLKDTAFLKLIKSKNTFLVDIQRNDTANGITTAQSRTNLTNIYNTLTNNGTTIGFILPITEAAALPGYGLRTAGKNYITATYPTSPTVDPAVSLSQTGVYVQADSTHPTELYHELIAYDIRNSLAISLRKEIQRPTSLLPDSYIKPTQWGDTTNGITYKNYGGKNVYLDTLNASLININPTAGGVKEYWLNNGGASLTSGVGYNSGTGITAITGRPVGLAFSTGQDPSTVTLANSAFYSLNNKFHANLMDGLMTWGSSNNTGNLILLEDGGGTTQNGFGYIGSGTAAGGTAIFGRLLDGGITMGVGLNATTLTLANSSYYIKGNKRNVFNYPILEKRTTVADANYTVTDEESLIAYTSLTAARTVTLYTTLAEASWKFTVKDEAGTAGTNNIIIDAGGTKTIDGLLTYRINSNYGSVTIYYDGTNFFTTANNNSQEQQKIVSTQFDKTSSTTLADVTGLSAYVLPNGTYRFEAILYTASNVAGGVKFAIAGTDTALNIIYEDIVTDNNTSAAQTRATSAATTVGAVTAVTNAYSRITGTITVRTPGTITVQFAQNASNATASSILVGSTFVVTRIY